MGRPALSSAGRFHIGSQQSSPSHLPNLADSSHSWPRNNSVSQESWSQAHTLLQQPAGGMGEEREVSGQLAFVTEPSLFTQRLIMNFLDMIKTMF